MCSRCTGRASTSDEMTPAKKRACGGALRLTDDGAKKFAEATQANLGKQIAIVYDGDVISAPTSPQSAITDGRCQITGDFTYEEADQSGFHHPYRFPFSGTAGAAF